MLNITELENLILVNAENYYEGRDCISDEEFDELVEQLRALDPSNQYLHAVGWGYDVSKSNKKKARHMNYLSGIDNKPRVSKTDNLPSGVLKTPKLDGGSVELQYRNGILQRSLTRGNGVYGLDCTSKLMHIIPNELPIPYTGNIIGEYLISNQNLEGFSDSISQRNIPNGFLGRDYASEEDCKRFSFVAYKVGMSTTHRFDSRVAVFEFLRNLGFHTVDYVIGSDSYENLLNRLKVIDGQTYLLDGIVSGSAKIYQNEEGIVIYPDEIAYKIISATAKPKVKKIDWNLTRTGKLVPTVVTEDIVLSGANINRFLAHNAWYVQSQGIEVGARLEVTRSGEVIPYILDVVEPMEAHLPEVCSACSSRLEWSGVHLVCNNPDCSSQSYSRIYHWIKILTSVDNLGSSLISALVEALDISSIEDLYKEHDLSLLRNYEGVGESKIRVVQTMFDELNSKHSIEAYLMAMNIQGLGHSSAKKICASVDVPQELESDYYSSEFEDRVLSIKGVNYPTKVAILRNWGRILDLSKFMHIISKSESEEKSDDSGKIKVCITGKLNSMTKSEFYKTYSDKVVESSVKDCDYLICNNDRSSSKYNAAVKLKKPILTEDEFLSTVKEVS